MLHDPSLLRVLAPDADLAREPLTEAEEIFVTLVIQHLHTVVTAMRDELTINPEGLRRDLRQFLARPIPGVVWNGLKAL